MSDDELFSARAALQAFLRSSVALAEHEIVPEVLIEQAVLHFNGDPEFQEAAAREFIEALTPGMVNVLVGQNRRALVRHRRDELRGQAELSARERFARVFAGTGAGSYRAVIDMRKVDGQLDLDRRESEVAGHRVWIGFWRDVLPQMDDVRSLGRTFNDRQLTSLWNQHFATES